MGTGGKCFVATAAYGSDLAPEIVYLSRFRDKVLLRTPLGKALVGLYYRAAPCLANFIKSRPKAQCLTRQMLRPIVRMVRRYLNVSGSERP